MWRVENWKILNKIWKISEICYRICIHFLIVPGLQWQLNLFVLFESLSYLSNKGASTFKGLQINPFQCLFTKSIPKSKDTYIIFSNQQIHVPSDLNRIEFYTWSMHCSCYTKIHLPISAMFKKFYQFLHIIHVISTITSDFVKKESFVKGLNLYMGPIDLLEKNNFVRKCLQMHLIKALTKIWKGSCHTCINVFNKLVRFCQRYFGKSPLKRADKWVCLESPTHCVHC